MFLVSLQSYSAPQSHVVTACDTAAMPAGHQKNIPLLVRALLRIGFCWRRIDRIARSVHEETVVSWVSPSLREPITTAIYDSHPSYLAGGLVADGGLFDRLFPWEEALLAASAVNPPGRVLLGAAGAGRELKWLCRNGFEVTAFEPSDLVDRAAAVAAMYPTARVIRAFYRDVIDAIESARGPLAEVLSDRPFDMILLGWGSLSYLWNSDERLQMLRLLRTHSPRAPILASFRCRDDDDAGDVLRRRLRRFYRALGAPGHPQPGLRFFSIHGFAYHYLRTEIESMALDAGYTTAMFNMIPYPHILFVPRRDRSS